MRAKLIYLLFFLLGAFSLLSQTILIREYLISFQGNEIAIGIFYASWFLWIALGASLTIVRKGIAKHFLKYLIIYPFLSLIAIFLFRSLRGIAQVEPWELFPLQKALPLTVLINGVISFFTGIIFTSGCHFLKFSEGKSSQVVSKAYIYESLGSFLSGVVATSLLLRLIPLFSFLILLGLATMLVSVLTAGILKEKFTSSLGLIFLLLYSGIALSEEKLAERLAQMRWKYTLPGAKLVEEISTPYQHLSLAKLRSQLILLLNGKVLAAFPDKISGYQMAALFISMLDLPKEILIFGYGSENYIRYLLDFPIESISYLIPDQAYFKLLSKYLPSELEPILKEERIEILFRDPRAYLADMDKNYDLIVLNLPDPGSARLNKYYTLEFYQLLKQHLSPKGAIAVRITSAENFIGSEIRNYGSSIYYTLKKAFEKIAIIPGEINWFFAGGKNSKLVQEPEILAERYQKYITPASTFSPEGFYSLILKNRVEFLNQVYLENPIFKQENLINSDKKPLSYFLNLLVLARYTNSGLVKILKAVSLSGWLLFLFPILLFLSLRLHYLIFIENNPQKRLIFNSRLFQLFSGASAFSYHIILIFLFQNRFGTLFQFIALVNALFMLGLFLGSLISRRLAERFNPLKLIFGVIFIQLILYFSSYPILEKFLPLISKKLSLLAYLLLFFSSGALTGSSYPLAGKVLERAELRIINLAGSLEALDHWGASLGALLSGIIIIPLLGIYKSLLLLGAWSLSLLLLISLEVSRLKLKTRVFNPKSLSFPYLRTSYILFAISSWSLFTFNYLEKRKNKLLELQPPRILLQALADFQRSEFKDKPLPHYIGYRGEEPFYIFSSRHLNTSSPGFGGPVEVSLLLDEKRVVKKILLEGERESSLYLERVKSGLSSLEGKKIYFFLKAGKNIDAITGATITSRAAIRAIEKTSRKIVDTFFQERASPEAEAEFNLLGLWEGVILLLFAILGLVLFLSNTSYKMRILYLIALTLILGFKFNLQLSYYHIFNLLWLNLPTPRNLSLFLLTFLPLLLGIFYGRFYCGWLCPFGALQEIIGNTRLRLRVARELERKASYFKFVLLTILILLFSATREINLYLEEPLAQAFLLFQAWGREKILLATALFFSLFFFRFWCKYFCILGAFLSLFNKIAILKFLSKKKIVGCQLNLENFRELDCLQCNRCLGNESK